MAVGLEIEKKYLIAMPDRMWLQSLPGIRFLEIRQTYLLGPEGETERVRRTEEQGRVSYTHTLKKAVSSIVREETEDEISAEEYETLLQKADPLAHPVEKTRAAFPWDGHVMEIDLYPFWDRQAVLEVELKSEEESFTLPPEIQILQDVSADRRYRNAALARDFSLAWRKGTVPDETLTNCREFVRKLGSSEPAPGGGGAAALAGALGAALAHMVGALTVGKKRYADAEPEIREAMGRLERLTGALEDQVALDAEGFLPLAKAYSIPKEDPDRDRILEEATLTACQVPLRIMELCGEALQLTELMARKGSKLAQSDAGCSAALLLGALKAASLNVYINTKFLKDREKAEALNCLVRETEQTYTALGEGVFALVREELGGR